MLFWLISKNILIFIVITSNNLKIGKHYVRILYRKISE